MFVRNLFNLDNCAPCLMALLRLAGELLFLFGFFTYDDSLSLDSILLRVSKNR